MTRFTISVLLILLGLIIVALPDSGHRLFSVNEDHGPSLQDAAGLILILVPYTWLVIETWQRKHKILKYQDTSIFKLGLFFSGMGYGLIIGSLISNFQYWWILGIVLLILIHIAVFYVAFREKRE